MTPLRLTNFDLPALLALAHSPIHNYVIPGLTSSLLGAPSPQGCVRLFECSREHQEAITPHSHRFDLQCIVLQGWVENKLWVETEDEHADAFAVSHIKYLGEPGAYEKRRYGFAAKFAIQSKEGYGPGDCYQMKSAEIHSIAFSRNAKVLFFEGPTLTDISVVIEPWVNGKMVPTSTTQPWMFDRS